MPPPGSVAPAEPALERWLVQHLRRRVEAVAGCADRADGPEKMGVVVVVAPLAAAPLFPGAFPRRSALASPAIEDHLGGVAVAETLPEELEELGPLGRHDIEVTTRRGHGDKRRRFAPNLPEALTWEAMRPRPRGEPSKPGDRDRKSTRLNSSHLVISYAVFCLKKKNQRPPRALMREPLESPAAPDRARNSKPPFSQAANTCGPRCLRTGSPGRSTGTQI